MCPLTFLGCARAHAGPRPPWFSRCRRTCDCGACDGSHRRRAGERELRGEGRRNAGGVRGEGAVARVRQIAREAGACCVAGVERRVEGARRPSSREGEVRRAVQHAWRRAGAARDALERRPPTREARRREPAVHGRQGGGLVCRRPYPRRVPLPRRRSAAIARFRAGECQRGGERGGKGAERKLQRTRDEGFRVTRSPPYAAAEIWFRREPQASPECAPDASAREARPLRARKTRPSPPKTPGGG
jgi:hypothetical protein